VDPVYLDYNATAPVKPEVSLAIAESLQLTGNPSSVHSFGRAVRQAIEDSRDQVAALVGTAAADVVFTAGGSEANNLALRGTARSRLVVSAVEHPSVLKAAQAFCERTIVLPVDADGVVVAGALESALGDDGRDALVSIMLANNETGVIQPVAALADAAHAVGALFHCDAVQGPGRIPVDMNALGVDMLSLSAHKFGGPKGVGALFLKSDADVAPMIIGGGQERGRRAGTENVPGIVGLGKAAELASDDLQRAPLVADLRNALERALLDVDGNVQVFGAGADRLPNTSALSMPGVQSETQVMALDLSGVAVSAGSACSSGRVEPSHVLRAMGVDDAHGGCAIRVSLGWATTAADTERLVGAWRSLHAGLATRYQPGLSAAAKIA